MRRIRLLLNIPFILFFISCASTYNFAKIDEAAVRGDFKDSAGVLEKDREKAYRDKDAVLYYLDAGMLNHYAGNYAGSSELLQQGERAIERAFTKSISLEAGTYLVNDTVQEYAGEDYEDVYINVFNSLNYYHRDSLEGALVEIRRMNNKLRNLSVKYGTAISNLQKSALEQSVEVPYDPDRVRADFSNSALARYLGMLFYRGGGFADSARIDRDQVRLAFANQPSVYTFPVPSSLSDELEIPPGMARFNIVSFSGLSPVKVEETIRIPISNSNWIKLALPVLQSRPSAISRTEVVFDTGEHVVLELIEDIDAIARETFKQREGLIYFKTILRSLTKTTASAILDSGSQQAEDSGISLLFSLLSLGTQIYSEASEQADLRLSRYFPSKAHVGGINLEPGLYSFTVRYYGSGNTPIHSVRFEDVLIAENKVNLTEVICLK